MASMLALVNQQEKVPTRIGMIGVSGYAGLLADSIQERVDAGQARWIAAAGLQTPDDIARCEILARQGAQIFTDWRKLIDRCSDEIDLLLIPTAIHVHREMAEYALDHGLNVFLEKPLAATIKDAHAICQAAARSKGKLLIGYQSLYCESTHLIKKCILDGELGQIQAMRALTLWPRNASYYARNSWAGKITANGKPVNDSPVNNALAHYINLLLFWAGPKPLEPAQVEAVEGSVYRARDIESFDTASLCIHTAQGLPLEFHGSHSTRNRFDPEICILGSNGSIRWKSDRHAVIETHDNRQVVPLGRAPDIRRHMVDQLLRWAQGEDILGCTPDRAIGQTYVVDLIHRHLPINRIPDRYIELTNDQPMVTGLEEAFQKRYREGGCLDVGDTDWALAPNLAHESATEPGVFTHTS